MIPELEKHKLIIRELGDLEVIPYTVVLNYIEKLNSNNLDVFEKSLKELQDAIVSLNDSAD
jgi:hypothetical protein